MGQLIADEAAVRARVRATDLLEWNLSVLIDVSRALEFAHSRKIIHRDVKPENVMIGGAVVIPCEAVSRRDELRAFAQRDWAAIASAKERAWRELRREGGGAASVLLADELWRHARAVKPSWPSEAELTDGHQVLMRVFDALGRVPARRR